MKLKYLIQNYCESLKGVGRLYTSLLVALRFNYVFLTRFTPKFYSIYILVFGLAIWTCSDENIKSIDSQRNLNKRISDDGIEKYSVISCSNSSICYTDSACVCNQSSCCTRQDFDPCNYADGDAFAKAVACELTKISNGCGNQQGYQYGCTEQSWEICVDLGSPAFVHSSMTAIIPNANPFQFCSGAACDTFTCSSGTNPLRHFVMTIAYQNALLSWVRGIGFGAFSCGAGYYIAGFKMFFSILCTDDDCDNSNKRSNCHNRRLVVHFYNYVCCPQ